MRLGQHFLVNDVILQKIARALDAQPNETIVEIGAGHGELTEKIKNQSASWRTNIKIIAVEKDRTLIEPLREKFRDDICIIIVEGDILKILPELIKSYTLKAKSYTLTGNIPYYITGHLLRIIGELERTPRRSVFTIQKEVALRIAAHPPRMNKLAASVQFWAEPKVIGFVPKKDFRPAPEVNSAIIRLETKGYESRAMSQAYYRTIHILFRQPRKTILNNLLDVEKQNKNYKRESMKNNIVKKLTELGVRPEDRPQNLSIENIIAIANTFS